MIRLFAACIVLALLLSSCAALNYKPHSELIMFQEKELKGGERVKTRYAQGMASATFDLSDQSKLLSNHPDFENVVLGPYAGTHLVFMNQRGTAFSIAIGTGIGFDTTFPVLRRYLSDMYLTQTFSPPLTSPGRPGIQTIIQRRLHDGNPFGLSLGLNFQFRYNNIDDFQGDDYGCPGYADHRVHCLDFIPRHSIGIRSVMTYSIQPKEHIPSKAMLYSSVNLNYDWSTGFFYPALSVSIVFH